MPYDPRVDAYIAARAEFARPILTELRRRVHAACPDVVETIKWSMPGFDYGGHRLAGMAAFKAHAAFGFWRYDAIGTDRSDDAMGQFGRITSIADLPDEATFAALVCDAVALIDSGEGKIKRPKAAPKPEPVVPDELAEALRSDAAAAANFAAFRPGCRREYCEWIGEAKRPETRTKRAEEAIGWIAEGKRRNWKYENC